MTDPRPSEALGPTRREDFKVAIICALPLEYDAVILVFDQFWDSDGDRYGRALEDKNTYTTGRIGKHDVVLALLPHMGKVDAASAAASMRSSYSGLRLVLLVGICGGVPRAIDRDCDIFLGDVIISKSVVQYDFGRQYPGKFVRKDTLEDNLRRPDKNIGGLLATFETDRGLERLEAWTARALKQIRGKIASKRYWARYNYPGAGEDKLFQPAYLHKHHTGLCSSRVCLESTDSVCDEAFDLSCGELGCDEGNLVNRSQPRPLAAEQNDSVEHAPAIHIGAIASGDTVMKSAEHRDRIAKETRIVALEMEGAGVWEEVPSIIVKGVCDYADCHKNKRWQKFAAATAASTAKAVLESYIRTDRSSSAGSDGKRAYLLAKREADDDTDRPTVTGGTSQDEGAMPSASSSSVFHGPITARNMIQDTHTSGGTTNLTFN